MTNRERKYYNFRNEHIDEIDMIYKKIYMMNIKC